MTKKNAGVGKIHSIKVAIALMFGILLSMGLSAITVSNEGSLAQFYDNGEIYEMYGEDLYSFPHVLSGNGVIELQDVEVTKHLELQDADWNYLQVVLKGLNADSLHMRILTMDESGQLVPTLDTQLQEGENMIRLNEAQKCGAWWLDFPVQAGKRFALKSFRIYEQYPNFDAGTFALRSILFFLAYLILFFLIMAFWKKSHRSPLDGSKVVDAYRVFLEKTIVIFRLDRLRLSEMQRHFGRIACFVLLLFWNVCYTNLHERVDYYVLNILIQMSIFGMLTILSLEPNRGKRKWDTSFVSVWMAFWALTSVLDMVVIKKTYYFVGLVMLVGIGLFYQAWTSMRNPRSLLYEFAVATQIFFVGTVVFCVFCRPDNVIRYLGIQIDPNNFGQDLVLVATIVFAMLEEDVKKELSWKKAAAYSAELLWLFFFLFKTQSRAAALVMLAISFLFFLRLLWLMLHGKVQKQVWKMALCIPLLALPIQYGTQYAMDTVPYALHTEVKFQHDAIYPSKMDSQEGKMPFLLTVHASDFRHRVETKMQNLDSFTSGRLNIWKAYIREMNLVGHKWIAKVNGKTHKSHNMYLAITNRYGILALPLYLMMWFLCFRNAIDYMQKGRDGHYVTLPLLLCTQFLFLGFSDSMEEPWNYVTWVAGYFVMGILFIEQDRSASGSQEE